MLGPICLFFLRAQLVDGSVHCHRNFLGPIADVYKRATKARTCAEELSDDDEDIPMRAPKRRRRVALDSDDDDFNDAGGNVSEVDDDSMRPCTYMWTCGFCG